MRGLKAIRWVLAALALVMAADIARADFYPLRSMLDANFEGHFSFVSAKEVFWSTIVKRDTSLKNSVAVLGELEFPRKGQPPFPLVAIMHGTSGADPHFRKYVDHFKDQGYATLFLDSFSPRGYSHVGNQTEAVSSVTTAQDFYRAIAVVKTHPKINISRVAAVGFSKGGTAVLWMVEEKFRSLYAQADFRLRAAVAMYPGCVVHLQEPEASATPVLMLMGGADTYTPVKQCDVTVASMRKAGFDVTTKVYPGAVHAFDFAIPVETNDTDMSYGNCNFLNMPDGYMKDVNLDKVLQSSADLRQSFLKCGTKGITVGRNDAAARKSLRDMTDFINRNTASPQRKQ